MEKLELKDILAISGQGGLFRYIAPSSNGVIVEALSDGRRMNASGTAKISSMAEIAIYTDSEDMPLWKVFQAVYKHTEGKNALNPKSDPAQLKKLFAEILPDYDRDRVHVSDMKKVFGWYNILVDAGMTDFTIEEEKEESGEAKEEGKEQEA